MIDVAPEIQLERAAKRDQNHIEIIKNIMKSQVSRDVRLSYADDIIENNLPFERGLAQLQQQVKHLHTLYLQFAEEK